MLPQIYLYNTTPASQQWQSWFEDAGINTKILTDPPDVCQNTIVITDYPGSDKVRQWLDVCPNTRILCVVQADQIEAALASGVYDVVIEPVHRAVLVNRVQRMLPPQQDTTFANTMQDLAAELAAKINLDDVLHLILKQIKQVIPRHDAANIVLIAEDGDTLLITEGMKYFQEGKDHRTELKAFDLPLSKMPNLKKMFHTRQPLYIMDTQAGSWVPMTATDWIRSYLGAPIVVDGAVSGFINVDSQHPHSFHQRDADNLMTFAYHAGLAIRNARLFTQLTELTSELEQRVEERTRQLQDEKAQLNAILDSIGDGVIYHDEQATPRYTNRALEEMFGYSEAEWLTDAVQIIETNEAEDIFKITKQVNKSLANYGLWQLNGMVKRKDGRTFNAQVTIRQVIGNNDALSGSVTVYRDISQEQRLIERQAQFIAYASHELRTPITNLKTRLYLMHRQPEQMNKHLQIIEEVTERMELLVNGLLMLSRLHNHPLVDTLEKLDIREVIEAVCRVQIAEAEQKGILVKPFTFDSPVMVMGDQHRLVQVFTNLIANAILHTDAGRSLQIRLELSEQPGLTSHHSNTELELEDYPSWVGIHVVDEGVGIAPEHIAYLFQPFYRVNNQLPGTGLGLSIAAEIVRLHNGTIDIHSTLGQGSTFTVWLPHLYGDHTP